MNNLELSNWLIDKARSLGADEAEVQLSIEEGFTVNTRLLETETIEFHKDKSLALTVYKNKQKAFVRSSDFALPALELLLQNALSIANYSKPDPYNGLAESSRLATKAHDLKIYYPWAITTEQALQLAIKMEQAGLAVPNIVNSEGASVATYNKERILATSHGFAAQVKSTRHSLSCSLIAKDADDMQRDFEYSMARDANMLSAPELIGKKAAELAVKRLKPQKIKTQALPVIFAPQVAPTLFAHLVAALSGGNIYRGLSFLIDKVGTNIFPTAVTVKENPYKLGGLGSSYFDEEGVATEAKAIIMDGVLTTYLLNSYSAKRLGLSSTGNAGGVFNLEVKPTHTSAQLQQQLTRGIIVTELMGHGINLATGDYSRGASGFYVEHGVVQYPVAEITIAGNLKAIYANILAIADDAQNKGNISCGSVLVNELMVAGN